MVSVVNVPRMPNSRNVGEKIKKKASWDKRFWEQIPMLSLLILLTVINKCPEINVNELIMIPHDVTT